MPIAPGPIFLPENEPYLGSEFLKEFDITISRSLAVHGKLGPRTFASDLTPLQIATTEIVPQGVSIALSMRELIRQAYLYSAAILMRPLVERTGMVYYLVGKPAAVQAWHDGWPRKSQPSFDELLELVMPANSDEERKDTRELLNKLIHSDPRSSALNSTTRPDGRLGSAVGKELNEPTKADAISAFATRCLIRLTNISIKVLGVPSEQVH